MDNNIVKYGPLMPASKARGKPTVSDGFMEDYEKLKSDIRALLEADDKEVLEVKEFLKEAQTVIGLLQKRLDAIKKQHLAPPRNKQPWGGEIIAMYAVIAPKEQRTKIKNKKK